MEGYKVIFFFIFEIFSRQNDGDQSIILTNLNTQDTIKVYVKVAPERVSACYGSTMKITLGRIKGNDFQSQNRIVFFIQPTSIHLQYLEQFSMFRKFDQITTSSSVMDAFSLSHKSYLTILDEQSFYSKFKFTGYFQS